ncbi:MAG: rane or secreted protein [Segetibacter sp.]|nr:rane or secreted protein [Segetibacter sp.]
MLLVCSLCLPLLKTVAQTGKPVKGNLVYVDKNGVLRYTKGNAEAAFFGVNYTVPFAYGYRSVKRTGIELEQAIDHDVYHLARLGLDAFRVHVWDWEITDSLGNLLENEHLRLFDYLLAKLEERNIKILITPIAFWGNGYPEKDERTGSFSNVYGKGPSVVAEAPIKAQENYMKQFFSHVNPYTKLTYTNDPGVIAMEINNEPHHSGPKERTTEYINRLAAAVRSTGWTKPVFYNISESPTYADAVVKSNVDGHSFQWYPTGLVANHTLEGNFLPHVDKYHIPFDTIPAFKKRAKMVYEFDAGDVLQSYMYPAMVRSFRGAGMQWATQFAYDPMATAYANTEYQTHYVNLAYTPSKAISLMIASKAFHKLPRLKSYGTYPADSLFDVFRVSYKAQLSEMNSPEEFYYSNSTSTQPVNINNLKHIAGVGNSALVQYKGYGAYFLDQVAQGVWRLELMPDAIHIRDPFEKASPKKEVTRIQWLKQSMQIMLPDLGTDFTISGSNPGNSYSTTSSANTFEISPGTYILKSKAKSGFAVDANSKVGLLGLNEFVAPQPVNGDVYVTHQPHSEVSPGVPFTIAAKIVGVNAGDKVSAELRNSSGKWKTIQLNPTSGYDYSAEVPADIVTPGLVNYRIIIHKGGNDFVVFPGAQKEDPYAWDAYESESWETFVAPLNAPLVLFNANDDRRKLDIYNPSWRNNVIEYITAETPGQLVLKATMNKRAPQQTFGWQQVISGKLQVRQSEIGSFNEIVVKARTKGDLPVDIKIVLLTKDGLAFATHVSVSNQFKNIAVPLDSFKADSTLLLPRPYPGFQPLMFKAAATASFRLRDIEKMQVFMGEAANNIETSILELESIFLDKRK